MPADPTIHYNLPFNEYLLLPGWSWSRIKLIEQQSPLAVKYARDHQDPDTASRKALRLIHAMVLEAATVPGSFAVFDGTRRGRAYDDFATLNAGKTIVTSTEFNNAVEVAKAVHANPFVAELLTSGHGEVSFTWVDRDTGIPCKGRADWLGAALVDLKTLGTVNERSVARLVAQNLYHGQLAHYDDGLRALGITVPAYLVVAEGKGAQDVSVFEVDEGVPDGALHVGRELRRRVLGKLAACIATNHWPGRHEGPQLLALPQYALLDAAGDITFGADEAPGEG